MKKMIIAVFSAVTLFLSCEKEDETPQSNAKIIGFNSDKCMCYWGWTIKMGNDNIRSDDPRIGFAIGYEISEPISVFIELGAKNENCSPPNSPWDHYDIQSIKQME